MKFTKESEDKIIHFGLIIFLICSIIVLLGSLFLVFDIDLGELFTDKENLRVKVVNNYDETLYLECAFYFDYEGETSMKIYKGGALEPGGEYIFTHGYTKTSKVNKVDLAAYSSSNYGLDKRIAYNDYDFSDDPYDLLGIISTSGDTITITKLS